MDSSDVPSEEPLSAHTTGSSVPRICYFGMLSENLLRQFNSEIQILTASVLISEKNLVGKSFGAEKFSDDMSD